VPTTNKGAFRGIPMEMCEEAVRGIPMEMCEDRQGRPQMNSHGNVWGQMASREIPLEML